MRVGALPAKTALRHWGVMVSPCPVCVEPAGTQPQILEAENSPLAGMHPPMSNRRTPASYQMPLEVHTVSFRLRYQGCFHRPYLSPVSDAQPKGLCPQPRLSQTRYLESYSGHLGLLDLRT